MEGCRAKLRVGNPGDGMRANRFAKHGFWFRLFGTNDGTKPACFLLTISGHDDDFLREGALVTLASLRATNPDTPIVIFYDNLTRKQRRLFSDYDLRKADVHGFHRSTSATKSRPDLDSSVFLRFSVENLSEYDLVLYLDCDLVVLDSIDEIFDLTGELMGRVMDDHPLVEQFVRGEELLIKERVCLTKNAVNAGVFRYDTRFCRKIGLRNEIVDLAKKYGWDAFRFSDQSLLNLLGYKLDKITHFSKVYNFALWPDMRKKQHVIATNGRGLSAPLTSEGFAKIVHWTGPLKPWHPLFQSLPASEQEAFCAACYQQFARRTRGQI